MYEVREHSGLCGGQCVVDSVWWAVCGGAVYGGQCMMDSVWWAVCGGQCVVKSVRWGSVWRVGSTYCNSCNAHLKPR